ncbi:MAG: DUF2905 domain-containing protein [Deltaproteobacteria bacterium]|nr:DUF2905 domain-containing protein [Deltaproteobacteria bacterium]
MTHAGKVLILVGLIIVAIGILLTFGSRVPYIGRLPGDIYYKRGDFVFYFPLVTSIIVSIIFTLILYLFFRR